VRRRTTSCPILHQKPGMIGGRPCRLRFEILPSGGRVAKDVNKPNW